MNDDKKTYTAADMREAFFEGSWYGARNPRIAAGEVRRIAFNLYPDPKKPREIKVGTRTYRVREDAIEWTDDGGYWHSFGYSRSDIRAFAELFDNPMEPA